MIGKNTEEAIKAWLALPEKERIVVFVPCFKSIHDTLLLYQCNLDEPNKLIAKFTIASIVAKRYPRRKKVKG